MAATNPFRVSDLIAKYGWQIMPYLSNLGVRSLAEAQVLFVDSGHTNALDADDTEHGHSFEKPLATWDYAVGLLTADEGGVILMAPGHNEDIADGETIDNDVDGIVCIGLGTGTLRPRFDFDAAASTIDVGANNVTFVNLTFMPGAGDVLIGVDVEAGKTNFRMVDCEYLEGEASGDEFLAAVELKAGCHDAVIENNVFRAGWSSNPDDAISLKGASNNVTLRNNRCSGPYGDGAGVTAAISNSTGVCLDLLIENNILKVKDGESGIEVIATTPAVIRKNLIISTGLAVDSMIVATIGELDQNVGVTSDGTSGEFIKGGAISPEVVQYNLDHLAKTDTGVVADADISGIVVDGSILGHIMAASADPADFNASTDSLEAISVVVNNISSPTDVTAAVPAAPVAKSVQDMLNKDRAGSNTYDSSTDSLEAIRDYIAGTTALDAINLDHLALTSTGVIVDGELDTHITALSILGHIMATDADPSSYNCSTDSLQSIATAIAAITDNVTAAVPNVATARSLQDILNKNDSGNFDDSTDSLEAIRDHLDGTTILAGIQLDHLMQSDTTVAGDGDLTSYTADGSLLAHIMSATANTSTYAASTDSLEAIAVALAAGTGCTAAIEADGLDHLCQLDDTSAYPNVVTDSIIAKICAIGAAADPSTFDNTEDSLQAISEFVRTGATLGAGINLDHLMKTAVTDEQAMTEIATGSALAHILVKGAAGATTDFDPLTDSLQAISDKAGGFSGDGGTVFDDSIYACLVKMSGYLVDGDGDFVAGTTLPSNMSLVDIIGDFTGAHDGADYDDNIFSCLKQLSKYIVGGDGDFADGTALPSNVSLYEVLGAYTADGGLDDEDTIMAHLDLIYADTKVLTNSVTKTKTNLSAATGETILFTVSGGPVKITSIVGVVANIIKNATINCKITAKPTTPGNAVDVTATVDIDTAAVGTTLTPGATFGAALVLTANGVIGDMGFDFIADDGSIIMNLDANGDADDSIEWYIRYEPLVSGAAIAAA